MVRARRPELLDRVLAGRHADRNCAGGVRRVDITRSVTDDQQAGGVERVTVDPPGAIEGQAGELGTAGGVRAVAAEAEKLVQVGASELDVRSRLPAHR